MKPRKGGWRDVTEEDLLRFWDEMVARAEAEAQAAGKPHMIFTVGGQLFALPADSCRAVVERLEPTPLPLMPRHILGVSVIRGRPISITDLAALLGQEAGRAKGQHMVVVYEGEEETALQVERVVSVRAIDPDGLEEVGNRWEGARVGLVAGFTEVDDKQVHVLSVERCLRAAAV